MVKGGRLIFPNFRTPNLIINIFGHKYKYDVTLVHKVRSSLFYFWKWKWKNGRESIVEKWDKKESNQGQREWVCHQSSRVFRLQLWYFKVKCQESARCETNFKAIGHADIPLALLDNLWAAMFAQKATHFWCDP